LKPSNILIENLSESLRILKIGDISISNIDIHLLKKLVVGKMDRETSPAYIAPEVIKNDAATNKVDM
jgi:serine/threonine protein kinase